jgi:lactose/cellobiose-specific phosphotransferase system IIC component
VSATGLNGSLFGSIERLAAAFSENKTVRAINDGLINLIPLVLVGTICIALSNFPIPHFHEFLDGITGGQWTVVSYMITFATVDIIGLAALASVSSALVSESPLISKHEINAFIPVFTAFSCYVLMYVWQPTIELLGGYDTSPQLLFPHPGRTGVFYALIVALISTRVFLGSAKLWLRFRGGKRGGVGTNLQLRSALSSVFPVVCTVFAFVVLRLLLDWLVQATALDEAFVGFFERLVTNGDFLSVLLSVLLMQVLWFFGAHGSDTMFSFLPDAVGGAAGAATEAGASAASAASAAAQTATQTLQQAVATESFYTTFVGLGGAGATLGLLLVVFIVGSAGRGKKLAKLSVFPSIFNINETLLYGIPIVLNPFFIAPFILAPLVTAALTYGAFATGLVVPIAGAAKWTTPLLLSGYLETGSLTGSLLQFVGLAASCFIYLPFVLLNKNYAIKRQNELASKLVTAAVEAAKNEQMTLINRRDDLGEAARDFAAEINEYFDNRKIPFRLVYQPKSDKDGRVIGAEALLRWMHPQFGPISPVALIELTDEAGLTTPLGRWITRTSFEEFVRWKGLGVTNLVLSVNLNPRHIFEDPEFPAYVGKLIDEFCLNPAEIELEITEHMAVRSSDAMRTLFEQIRALGVGLSIDDMGMGYSSLTYISDFGVGTVKIDISLVNKVTEDVQQREIVSSVVDLARQLNLVVIVEGVEYKEQMETLVSLGCHYFQGYYFSKPLEPDDFVAYVLEKGTMQLQHGL